MAEETFQFVQEIKGLMTENLHSDTSPTSGTGSSFTALLGLPANQAMELLHEQEPSKFPAIHAAEIWNDRGNDQKTLNYSFNCSPSFPSNSALVERAARFSIFAENSPEASSIPSNSTENSLKLKTELTDSDSNLSSSPIFSNPNQRSTKRKEREKKNNGSARKSKKVENRSLKTGEVNKDEEQLSYVHVRARRGQATDSHSLAERARREKINARMKLLQELVPGCSKISGTASVLDEIINHVQALQRQVEFLSMRLATVNPRIDFNLDSLLAAESGCLFAGNNSRTLTVEPRMWPEIQVNGARQQQHQNQHPQVDVLRPPAWESDNSHSFITQENSLFSYDSPLNSVSLRLNQLNMGL